MIEAEVVYCVQHEYCLKPMDFLARRTRLAFLDVAATEQVRLAGRSPRRE